MPIDPVGGCVRCGATQSLRVPDYCARCGAPVLLPSPTGPPAAPSGLPGVWRYAGRLALDPDTVWLSLGEGGTPLIPAAAAGRWCGLDHLALKLDHLNPSGSFKDRATAVGLAHAAGQGAHTVLCSSSGNAAGSTAAYAAHAGMRAVLLVPEAVPPGKLAMASAYGAHVLRMGGDYSNAFAAGRELARRHQWSNLTTTYVNPVAIDGLKTVGYELAEACGSGATPEGPDWILVPVGAGPLVHGVVAAFRELVAGRRIARMPKVAAVQVRGCAPVVEAFERGAEQVRPWEIVRTTVSAISDPLRGYPQDGTYTLALVRETGGVAVAVEDGEADEAARRLAHHEGLLIEDGAACVLAGARALRERGVLAREDRVVALLTGNGLKTLRTTPVADSPVVTGVDEAESALRGTGVLP